MLSEGAVSVGSVSEAHTWSVPEVNEWLATTIAQAFPDDVWVEGEICNLSRSSRGHVYFTLIEPGDDRRSASSSLSVTLFDWYRQKVNLASATGRRRGPHGGRRPGPHPRRTSSSTRPRARLQFRMIVDRPRVHARRPGGATRAASLAALAADGLLDANARSRSPTCRSGWGS